MKEEQFSWLGSVPSTLESWRKGRRAYGLWLQGLSWRQVGLLVGVSASAARARGTRWAEWALFVDTPIKGNDWLIL